MVTWWECPRPHGISDLHGICVDLERRIKLGLLVGRNFLAYNRHRVTLKRVANTQKFVRKADQRCDKIKSEQGNKPRQRGWGTRHRDCLEYANR
jgi:hypothetical protein